MLGGNDRTNLHVVNQEAVEKTGIGVAEVRQIAVLVNSGALEIDLFHAYLGPR